MSAVRGDLFYLPLQSALTASDMRMLFHRSGGSNGSSKNADSTLETRSGFWTQFIGDGANEGLKCLSSTADFDPHFWPLVLYGDGANGKTSIAMAFANRLANENGLCPVFVRAADLVRRYRDAVQTDSVADFRKSLLTADMLVIDDLHLLSGKSPVQSEIAKLIDSLTARKKPVLATINALPSACEGLIPQLVSRLSSGLVLPVNRPGQMARRMIIARLSERFQLVLDDSAVEFIASHCEFPVPRLTQLFAQLKHSMGDAESLDATHVKQTLFGDRSHYDQDIQLIIEAVAAHFELSKSEVRGKSRKQTTVLARSICIFLCRDLLQLSFSKIGRCFSNRDHSTIIHAYKNVEKTFKKDANVNPVICELRRKLTDRFLLVVHS